MRLLLYSLILLVVGCGYHTPGSTDSWVGGDARTVYVRLFDNKVAEPYLDNFITEALVAEFSRSRLFELTEEKDKAALHLVGSVDSFSSRALAYNSKDRITEYRAIMQVSVQLLELKNDQIIWKDVVSEEDEYFADVDKNTQLDEQREAGRKIAMKIAEDIHAHLLNTF